MAFKTDTVDVSRGLMLSKMFACLALGLLGVRLWYLQGIYGSYYRDLSENNRTRTIRTAPPRGVIYDREGRILVRNRPAFDVALLLEDTPDVPETINRLAHISGRDPETVIRQFRSSKKTLPFEPRVVLPDVSREELARVKVNTPLLPGVIVTTVPARAYPNEQLAAQLFGYVREITKEQLDRSNGFNRRGDFVGQAGLEKRYEPYLRGRAGYVQVEVDARGARKGELGIADDVVGQDLHLTLDYDLQRAAEQALAGKRGAVVALEPATGEVLALVSAPTFDANLFSGQVLLKEWSELNSDKDKPLTNRALTSAYPPGSVVKLLWSVAGLNEGVISPETRVYCPGYYQLGRRKYRCHKKTGHGSVDLRAAIRQSCNVYYYQLGQALGIDAMHRYLNMFGFGQISGIDLPGEETGISPSPEWKQARFGEKWYPGDSVPVSIGQGYLIVTPLQMASFAATLANGGTLHRPMLVKRVINPVTQETIEFSAEVQRQVTIKPEVMRIVREYSGDVVNHEQGTGKRAKLPGILVGGKTGTAQVRAGLHKASAEEHKRDHAWFVALAPIDKPTIALSIIVENTGGGGMFAAPIAREVLAAYFLKNGMLKPEDLELEVDPQKPAVQPAPEQARAAARPRPVAALPVPAPAEVADVAEDEVPVPEDEAAQGSAAEPEVPEPAEAAD